MSLEKLIEEARLKSGITPEARVAAAQARMDAFNIKAAKEWKAIQVTPELLDKVISL